MRIYVASSWRNTRQPAVVAALRAVGHVVYDFRHPARDDHGFHWSEIDPRWQKWTSAQFRDAINRPVAVDEFTKDMEALDTADAVVLVIPCGRSAHLELGYAIGRDARSAILLEDGEPELMYRMADALCLTIDDVVAWAATIAEPSATSAPQRRTAVNP